MSPEQKALVKATIPVLKESGVQLTDYFYQRMLRLNPELKETFNLGHQRSGAQAQALAGAVLAYAQHIDNPAVLGPAIELICQKHVSLNIRPEDYAIVGENLLHSISEVLSIPMNDPLITAWAVAYEQLASILAGREATLYQKQVTTAGSWQGWRDFIVERKVAESDDVFSFYLVPEDKQPLPDYRPGQYITVRLTVPELGLKQPRQYTLSDSPSGQYFRISVKREKPHEAKHEEGYVSSTLHQHISEGDYLEVSAPAGNFFLRNQDCDNVFISAGICLTPMIAMVSELLKERDSAGAPAKQISFLYAARSPSVQPLRQQMAEWQVAYPRLHTWSVYETLPDDFPESGYQGIGRLDLSTVPKALLPEGADYYLCGPLPFMQQQYTALIASGISPEQIYSEAFGTGGVALPS